MGIPVISRLIGARAWIDECIDQLERVPGKNKIVDLLNACQVIDDYYQEFCDESDDEYGQPKGTTYKHGINLEFYIEAEWWHDVSIALRGLGYGKKEKEQEEEEQ